MDFRLFLLFSFWNTLFMYINKNIDILYLGMKTQLPINGFVELLPRIESLEWMISYLLKVYSNEMMYTAKATFSYLWRNFLFCLENNKWSQDKNTFRSLIHFFWPFALLFNVCLRFNEDCLMWVRFCLASLQQLINLLQIFGINKCESLFEKILNIVLIWTESLD